MLVHGHLDGHDLIFLPCRGSPAWGRRAGRARFGVMKLDIAGRELAYQVYGSGKTVVLLHAFPFDGRMWRATAEALADRGRVVVPDLRGFGASQLGEGEVSIAGMADDVAALLDHLGVARATVGGLSMGGYVALAFAGRHGARLDGLVLADTRAAADSDKAKAGRAEALALVEREGVAAYVERQIPALLSPSASEAVRQQVRELGKQLPAGVSAGLRALRDRPDRRGELAAIACPTLVIAGTADALSTLDEMTAMASGIAGARLVPIPGAGHLSNLERPDEFVDALRELVSPGGA